MLLQRPCEGATHQRGNHRQVSLEGSFSYLWLWDLLVKRRREIEKDVLTSMARIERPATMRRTKSHSEKRYCFFWKRKPTIMTAIGKHDFAKIFAANVRVTTRWGMAEPELVRGNGRRCTKRRN